MRTVLGRILARLCRRQATLAPRTTGKAQRALSMGGMVVDWLAWVLFGAESALGTVIVACARDGVSARSYVRGWAGCCNRMRGGGITGLEVGGRLLSVCTVLGALNSMGGGICALGRTLLGPLASLGTLCVAGLVPEFRTGNSRGAETLVGRRDCWAMSAEAVITRASWVPATLSRPGSSLAASVSSCWSLTRSSVEDGSAARASLY
jgi:hypothetical protein